LFDEPLSNLDAELRVAMRIEISDLHARLGNTMIYVTHDQVEAMTMADKIAVLRAGRLEQFGRPLDIFNAPANRFVAGFIGSPAMNFAAGEIADDGVILKTGERIALPQNRFAFGGARKVELGFRPSHLEISDTTDGLAFQVSEVEQLGAESFLYGKLIDDTPVTLHRPGQGNIARGDLIHLRPQAEHLHLFDATSGESLRAES
jgi:multiple sugar transport system ATP-binding protein